MTPREIPFHEVAFSGHQSLSTFKFIQISNSKFAPDRFKNSGSEQPTSFVNYDCLMHGGLKYISQYLIFGLPSRLPGVLLKASKSPVLDLPQKLLGYQFRDDYRHF